MGPRLNVFRDGWSITSRSPFEEERAVVDDVRSLPQERVHLRFLCFSLLALGKIEVIILLRL
jgi:hypothetical protein